MARYKTLPVKPDLHRKIHLLKVKYNFESVDELVRTAIVLLEEYLEKRR